MNASMVLWIIVIAVGVALLVGLVGVRVSLTQRRARLVGETTAIRAHALKGRDVMTIADARRAGRVDDVLFDREWGNVVAFLVKGRRTARGVVLFRHDVTAVGPDAIMVSAPELLDRVERRAELERTVKLHRVRRIKVVTKSGERLGKIWELELDHEARRVTSYLLRGSLTQRVRHRSPAIPVRQVIQIGDRGFMVVEDQAAVAMDGEAGAV